MDACVEYDIGGSLRSHDGCCNEKVTSKVGLTKCWIVLSLDWHEWLSCKGRLMKDLLLRARVVVRTKNVEISRCCLPDYVKEILKCTSKCVLYILIIFRQSTNGIVDSRRRCRPFLNSPSFPGP